MCVPTWYDSDIGRAIVGAIDISRPAGVETSVIQSHILDNQRLHVGGVYATFLDNRSLKPLSWQPSSLPPSPYHHHLTAITLSPPPFHHHLTITLPPQPYHHHLTTITLPPLPYHHHLITSPYNHHLTFLPPPPYHLTTTTLPPSQGCDHNYHDTVSSQHLPSAITNAF